MADERLLTDRYLRALPPARRGERDEVWDSRVTGFGVRVSDIKDADPARRGKTGKITFILRARFLSGAAPTRRTIGTYGAIALEDARRTVGEWRSLIAKGIDPAVVEAEAREKADRERALRIKHSFGSVAEAFVTDKLKQERSGATAERDFRANFVAIWRERPISQPAPSDGMLRNSLRSASPIG
jgi:Arm DNA-binding domain